MTLTAGVRSTAVQGWYLYRFDTDLHCAHGPSCPIDHPLYRGKSNEPLRRLLEEARREPWFAYVTAWSVDPGVYATNGDVLGAERAAILAELPLANQHHNQGNTHRLEFGSAVRAPRRVPMSQSSRHRVGRPRRALAAARRAPRAVWWLAAWLVLAATFSTYCIVRAHVGVRDGLIVGCVGAAGALIGVARARRPRRRRRRRRW